MSSIAIHDVSLFYQSRNRTVHALSKVNLEISEGEFVCLVGPSGCGKTTLLNIIGGFLKPSEGRVMLGGKAVEAGGLDRGIVFQEYALFPWRTALKNVEFGLEMKGMPEKERREVAQKHLALVKLEKFADMYPHHLSGGMKQRVAIARSLAYDPEVLLMDEPFGALDALTREELQKLLVDVWQKTKKTIVYVTHNVAEAVYLADRVVVFSCQPGRIKTQVKIHIAKPRDPLTMEFIQYQKSVTQWVTEVEQPLEECESKPEENEEIHP